MHIVITAIGVLAGFMFGLVGLIFLDGSLLSAAIMALVGGSTALFVWIMIVVLAKPKPQPEEKNNDSQRVVSFAR